MRKVFISHPYSDNPELRLKQVDYICRNLPPNILPISPLHLFAFEEDDNRRGQILQVCYKLIQMCDGIYIYNYGKLSAGQIKELNCAEAINHNEKTGIEIVEKKPPKRCIAIEKFNKYINEGWI